MRQSEQLKCQIEIMYEMLLILKEPSIFFSQGLLNLIRRPFSPSKMFAKLNWVHC